MRSLPSGGVTAAGSWRIRFDFVYEGRRYRPSLRRLPTEANLRRCRKQMAAIKQRIAAETFSFAEEFPDYRFLHRIAGIPLQRSCAQVFDEFLEHCESRLRKGDIAPVTLVSYRKILNGIWRPAIGSQLFLYVRYSTLIKIADSHEWSKKTYNNAVSVLRGAFEFGYRDYPDRVDPARHLHGMRMRRRDRPRCDPFNVREAELLIAAIHDEWGEAQGNYDEFRFFTGLRPSEQIALQIGDVDEERGVVNIDKARVAGVDKPATKTAESRTVTLCPRARQVLKRQLALRARLVTDSVVDHDNLFFKQTGPPIRNLQYVYTRWRRTLAAIPSVRYRKPYAARHTSVSWNLMTGKNPLWVAKQHGHSVETMLRIYAAWTEGANESDVQAVKRAMGETQTSMRSLEGCVRRSGRSRWAIESPGGPLGGQRGVLYRGLR